MKICREGRHIVSKFDIVVGGGGINGLSAAAYMVKAGLNVCLLEYQDYLGGGCWSMEDPVVPGVIHDPCATVHALIQYNPLLANDELGLKSKYGLKYITPDALSTNIFPEKGIAITKWRDMDRMLEEIATKLSEREAANYKSLFDFLQPAAQMMVPGLFSPPVPFATIVSMLDGAGEFGQEINRMLTMSAWDIACEWFETDEMREVATRFLAEMMISPFEKGTGAAFVSTLNLIHTHGVPIAEGGSQALPDALGAYIRDNGGTIRTGVAVESIKVVGGEARAFVLSDGEQIEGTKGLFSTFHVKQLFGENGMVAGDSLSPKFRRQVANLRYSDYMALNQHIVIKEPPRYKLLGDQPNPGLGLEQAHGALAFRKFFNGMAVGEPSPADSPMSLCASHFDPTRSRNGEHTLYLYSFEPWDLYGDSRNWDTHGQEIADAKLEALRAVTTNMGEENILNRFFHTPLDYAREKPSWLHGDFCHLSQSLDQNLGGRPTQGMSRYHCPIDKLYVGGASAYPGPTITGGGRAQAQVVFEDLGIDFDDVIRG
jgi:phytoene dehydrogenase-like protein